MKQRKEKQISLPQSKSSYVFEYLEMIAACACIIMFVFAVGLRVCVVDGDSMNKTLTDKDIVITNDLFYEPERNDIVVFHLTNEFYNQPLIKRVIATEGQWIDIKRNDNSLTVTIYEENDTKFENPIVLEEKYAYYAPNLVGWAGNYSYPLQIPEGHVFVMGDNRWDSSDSRSDKVGLVDKRIIFGHVLFRVYPLNSISSFAD